MALLLYYKVKGFDFNEFATNDFAMYTKLSWILIMDSVDIASVFSGVFCRKYKAPRQNWQHES